MVDRHRLRRRGRPCRGLRRRRRPGLQARRLGNPCDARKWPSVDGTDQILQQAALSAIDGAACKLGVSSEALGLALTSQDKLDQFAKDNGISQSEVEQAARAGLLRAVDDGEASGEINGVTAFALRIAAQAVPIDRLIQLVRDQVYG